MHVIKRHMQHATQTQMHVIKALRPCPHIYRSFKNRYFLICPHDFRFTKHLKTTPNTNIYTSPQVRRSNKCLQDILFYPLWAVWGSRVCSHVDPTTCSSQTCGWHIRAIWVRLWRYKLIYFLQMAQQHSKQRSNVLLFCILATRCHCLTTNLLLLSCDFLVLGDWKVLYVIEHCTFDLKHFVNKSCSYEITLARA